MRSKMIMIVALTGALIAFAVGAFAQRREHNAQNQVPESQSQPTQPAAPEAGMMNQMVHMNQMMGQMTTRHEQMTGFMTKLIESMKAIENEKDPAALKHKLAEHRALLEQMCDQMAQQGGMMQNMSGMMTGSTANPTK